MTPRKFIDKWRSSKLTENAGSQQQFIDLCRMLDEPLPEDPDNYCFEKWATKDSGGKGRADVWKRGCFAWEYKTKGLDLVAAFDQLRRYALALDNPPLLIVSDMERFRIRTNWTGTESELHEFTLDDLVKPSVRDKLKWAMSDPERLRPGTSRRALTEEAAAAFAELAQSLRGRGHDPETVAHFVNRMVFCMFAEDVGLLPPDLFAGILKAAEREPRRFHDMAQALFGAMATGGPFGVEWIKHFNGGLFEDDTALALNRDEVAMALKAAALDWSEIDASIMGTLFERGLDPDKRSQLGAHYTDREKIMQIVEPVVVEPLRSEWQAAKGDIRAALDEEARAKSPAAKRRNRGRAKELLAAFAERLGTFTVLDPACGSGNFLYLGLLALKDLEDEVMRDAIGLGLDRLFPTVGPANVKGIEINIYAAELARVSVWIGQLQWMFSNGFGYKEDPILEHLDNIERRDAIVVEGGGEAEWPECDVVIGNPPFLGGKRLVGTLGEDYVAAMFKSYEGRVPKEADLVAYWLVKAGEHVAAGKAKRVGLVTTNSIRGGANRQALATATDRRPIFCARSDEDWVVDATAVRVSIVCFSSVEDDHISSPVLDDQDVAVINLDLTGRKGVADMDITTATRLRENRGVGFMGDTKGGAFDVAGDLARQWLDMPSNPNGRTNADVLKPWTNARDITRRSRGMWIVDFGWEMSEEEAAYYEEPFKYLVEHVRPVRQKNRRESYCKYWWRHVEPRQGMWSAFLGLNRYIATPRVAKHRLFVWLDTAVCPDSATIAIARDDDTPFGILHSRFHEAWSLRLGTSLEDRPRYTPTTTFETFPFPNGLTPDVPATEYADDPHAVSIALAARRLVELRDRWLNPPEWVEWREEPVTGYPKRPVPRADLSEDDMQALKKRTLTNLYNARPQWLDNAHKALDEAVAAAYGWHTDIGEEDALSRLLALNKARSRAEE